MNIIELSKIMASYQKAVKTISSDGSVFVSVGANKMEGERYSGTLRPPPLSSHPWIKAIYAITATH